MISFDHVTYTYEGKETPSLRDCTFSVKPGELILLTGESGCGKTTIIKLVNGLLQHAGGGTLAGTVMVGGQDVAQIPQWELARTVGSVFQNPKSQFFNLDTTSEVLFGLESLGASHDEMTQALESAVQVCGVEPLLERSIFALSGGEKQRIACASAWAMGPELFVLDEPSSNLDGEGIRQLREILKQLKKGGKTVLMAEHRLWYAADLADRVFYLRSGQMEREYNGKDFLALPEEERRSMGLRSIAEVPVSSPEPSPTTGADGLMVRELRATYNGAAVWEGVSFHAPRGQITAITGQNGAGKTTLARCLCGLMKEQSGTIFWDGKPLRRTERRRKREPKCAAEEQDADAELRDHYFVATLTEDAEDGEEANGYVSIWATDAEGTLLDGFNASLAEGEQLLAGETWTFEKRIGSWVTPEQEDTIETGSVGYRLIR